MDRISLNKRIVDRIVEMDANGIREKTSVSIIDTVGAVVDATIGDENVPLKNLDMWIMPHSKTSKVAVSRTALTPDGGGQWITKYHIR